MISQSEAMDGIFEYDLFNRTKTAHAYTTQLAAILAGSQPELQDATTRWQQTTIVQK